MSKIIIQERVNHNQEQGLQISQNGYSQATVGKNEISVFTSQAPSLSVLKFTDIVGLKAALTLLISEVGDFINISDKYNMGDAQIVATVNMIIEEYGYFKIDDFKVCFDRAMRGKYGKTFNRLDGMVIMEWLEKYDAERTMLIEEHHRSENKRLSQVIAPDEVVEKDGVIYEPVPMPDDVREKLRNLFKAKEGTKEVAREIKEDPYQVLANKFMRDFDRLYMANPVKTKQIRMIKKYGKVIGINEYLERKFYQYELYSERERRIVNER